MLDTSNYSKTSIKVIKSSVDFAARAHLCARAKWFCVATAWTELQAPSGSHRMLQTDGQPPCPCEQPILPPWRGGVGHVRGVIHPIHLCQMGRGWITSLPCHWARRSWGLPLTQLLWGEIKPTPRNPEIKPTPRNPESWICTQPNLCCAPEKQKIQSTASQGETDPAPEELGE